MICKLFILGLVSSILIQGCLSYALFKVTVPSEVLSKSDSAPADESGKNLTCEQKLEWYRNTTKKTQELFDKYYTEFKNLSHSGDQLTKVETEHTEFQKHIVSALDRYKTDAKKIYNISDDSARLAFCRRETDWFQVLDKNLTGVATNMKNDLLNILGGLGVSKETIDSLDKTLSRIVNFLFILDMTKNLFKDVKSLADEAFRVTDEGTKLEEGQEGKREGAEEEPRETNEIGHVEEAEEAINHHIDESAYNDLEAENEISNNLEGINVDREIQQAEEWALERGKDLAAQEASEHERATEEESEHEFGEEKPFVLEYPSVTLRPGKK